MRIAIASGKGGTGKTTIAVNLALANPGVVTLLDCDVEEPNARLFLSTRRVESETIGIAVPEVDESRCTACGACGRFCQFKAIVSLKTVPLIFPEMCHGCGGCARICPNRAIRLVQHPIGVVDTWHVETGDARQLVLVEGRANVGNPLSPPLIRAVRRRRPGHGTTVIDCPPGTSCPVVAAVNGSDFVVLVTEPTPFGLHDLKLAVETVRALRLRCGVVINRAERGHDQVTGWCRTERIPLLAEFVDDRRIAAAYSRGIPAVQALPELAEPYRGLLRRIEELARPAAEEPHEAIA